MAKPPKHDPVAQENKRIRAGKDPDVKAPVKGDSKTTDQKKQE